MAEIRIGSLANVPNLSPLTSPWAKDVTRGITHVFASKASLDANSTAGNWPGLADGARAFTTDAQVEWIRSAGAWVAVRQVGVLDTPVGAILAFGGSAAPARFLLCNGAAVSRTTYAELFAVLGIAYGPGDGSTTFAVPNLQGRGPMGRDAGQAEFAALAQTGGAKAVALAVGEMPGHAHQTPSRGTVSLADHPHDMPQVAAQGGIQSPWQDAQAIGTSSAGGGAAHQNLAPYQVVNFIIRASSS